MEREKKDSVEEGVSSLSWKKKPESGEDRSDVQERGAMAPIQGEMGKEKITAAQSKKRAEALTVMNLAVCLPNAQPS